MADSLLNEFFNPSIPDKRGIQILRGQFEKDKQIKKAIDSGDFSSNLFDFDKEKIFKNVETSMVKKCGINCLKAQGMIWSYLIFMQNLLNSLMMMKVLPLVN